MEFEWLAAGLVLGRILGWFTKQATSGSALVGCIAVCSLAATGMAQASLPSGSRGGGIGLYFNGVRQYAKLACPRLTDNDGDLTIEFWMRGGASTPCGTTSKMRC